MEKICKTCLNKGTPICQLCSFVKSPSGKETKPSCYTGDRSAALAGMTVSDMGAVLTASARLSFATARLV